MYDPLKMKPRRPDQASGDYAREATVRTLKGKKIPNSGTDTSAKSK